MNPVSGRRYFQTECVHVTTDKLGRTGYGQTGLEFAHIGGDEAGKHALNRHAKMLGLQRQISAEFLNKSLIRQSRKTTLN